MSERTVTIGEFFDLNAAYLVRSRLEAEGIPVFLTNENVVGLRDPQFLGGPGAELKVPADEVERAMAILRESEPEEEGQSPENPTAVPSTKGYRNGLRMLAIFMGLSALLGSLALWSQDDLFYRTGSYSLVFLLVVILAIRARNLFP